MSVVTNNIVLEPAAQEVADAFAKPPFIYELDYPAARKILGDAQAATIEKLPIDEEWGKRVTPHVLRHTNAMLLRAENIDISRSRCGSGIMRVIASSVTARDRASDGSGGGNVKTSRH